MWCSDSISSSATKRCNSDYLHEVFSTAPDRLTDKYIKRSTPVPLERPFCHSAYISAVYCCYMDPYPLWFSDEYVIICKQWKLVCSQSYWKQSVFIWSQSVLNYILPHRLPLKAIAQVAIGLAQCLLEVLSTIVFHYIYQTVSALQWFLCTVGLFAKGSLDNNCHKMFPWESIRTNYTVPCNRPLASSTYMVLILKQLIVFSMSRPTPQHMLGCSSSMMYCVSCWPSRNIQERLPGLLHSLL